MADELTLLVIFVLRLTLAASVGILMVLMTRRLVRASFGPVLAYRLWLIVPVAMLASLLPVAPGWLGLPSFLQPIFDLSANRAVFSTAVAAAPMLEPEPSPEPLVWTSVWLLGVIAFAVAIISGHLRALQAYGALTPASLVGMPVHRASSPGAGPSLIGLFRPRLIVPADFETRFTPREQMLVLEHERQHRRARDPVVNGVVAVLRCLNWFNPLVHWAATKLRIDQELACDAAVIARLPDDRRTYAEALLKTQLAPVVTQLSCQWPGRSCRLLVERVEMLGRVKPRGIRLIAGVAAVLAIGSGTSLTAWATQTPGFVAINAVARIPPVDETRRLAAFAASDGDSDGRIDKAGYAQVLETLGYSSQLESLFAQRDANKDGFVTAEEYRQPLPAGPPSFIVGYEMRRPGAGADPPP